MGDSEPLAQETNSGDEIFPVVSMVFVVSGGIRQGRLHRVTVHSVI